MLIFQSCSEVDMEFLLGFLRRNPPIRVRLLLRHTQVVSNVGRKALRVLAGLWACLSARTGTVSPCSTTIVFPRKEDEGQSVCCGSVHNRATRHATHCNLSSGALPSIDKRRHTVLRNIVDVLGYQPLLLYYRPRIQQYIYIYMYMYMCIHISAMILFRSATW